MSERIRIFSNGFEHEYWDESNCGRCPRKPHENDLGVCPIFDAIIDSMLTDGTFSPEIAERMGYTLEQHIVLGWPCKERLTLEPTGARPAAHEMATAGAMALPGFDPETRAAASGGGAERCSDV